MKADEVTNQASLEIIQKARDTLQEMEREFIMLRFKFTNPQGKYKNEIPNVPGAGLSGGGLLTTHPTRDKIFMDTVRAEMAKLDTLLSRPDSEITIKRLAAARQRAFVLVWKNQNAGRAHKKNWNSKSGNFLAFRKKYRLICFLRKSGSY